MGRRQGFLIGERSRLRKGPYHRMSKKKKADDRGFRNGGICGLDLDHTGSEDPDSPTPPEANPAPPVYGVAAFRGLAEFGAIPELAWLYSASALELGFTSSFDSMVIQAMSGGGGRGDGTAPDGPSEHQCRAANLQRRILQRLRRVPPRLQAVIEAAYTDRRYPNPDVTYYGAGIAALVRRADNAQGAFMRSPQGEEIAAFQAVLMSLHGVTGQPPDWSPFEAVLCDAGAKLRTRKKQGAEAVLKRAHEAYRLASMQDEPRRRTRKRRPRRLPDLVVAGGQGRSKRQLVEVARGEAA